MSTKYEPVFEIGDVDEYLNQIDVMVNDFSTLGGDEQSNLEIAGSHTPPYRQEIVRIRNQGLTRKFLKLPSGALGPQRSFLESQWAKQLPNKGLGIQNFL